MTRVAQNVVISIYYSLVTQ